MMLTKSAEWMLPFIEAVKPLVPKIRYLNSIEFKKPKLNTIKPSHGTTLYDKWSQRYEIVIYSHYSKILKRKPMKLTYVEYSLIESLECLAHELAHLRHFNHTPAHKILECKIKTRFMQMLKKLKYKSDEAHNFKFYLPPHLQP